MAINSAFMEICVRRQKRVGHQLPLQSSNGLGAEVTFAVAVRQVALRRLGMTKVAGVTDPSYNLADVASAVAAIATAPRRVFVALGRNELRPFLRAPQHHYLVRSIDPVDPPLALPQTVYITSRGPFDEADERALLAQHRIEVIIAKNSGGRSSYGKIAAARALGLPVVVLRRPVLPQVPAVETVEDVVAWLDHARTVSSARGV